MRDEAPLIFAKRLGGLFPVNGAARDALTAIEGQCVVKITRATANQRRRSLYWVVTNIVTDALNDLNGTTLTEQDMHDIIRKKLRYFDEVRLPSGDLFIKYHSTSDRKMSEPDRAKFMERAFAVYSRWLGVPVESLLEEGRKAA
jgi:hypothetical protein